MGGGHRAPALYVLGGGARCAGGLLYRANAAGGGAKARPPRMHALHLLSGHRLLRSFLLRLPVDWMSTGRRSKKEKHLDFPSPGHPCGPYPPLALPWLSLFTLPYINPILIHAQGPRMNVPPTTHYLAYTLGPTDAL